MAYVPQNRAVYIAAYAGALSGINLSNRSPSDPNAGDYVPNAIVAGAFAQSYDTARGAGATNTLETETVQSMCEAAWQNRYPRSNDPNLYTSICRAIIALVASGEAFFFGQGIDPDIPSGGSIPPATLPNAVVQVPLIGAPFSAPLTQDQILPGVTATMANAGATFFEVSENVVTPAFTATQSAAPSSAILTDSDGNAPKNVTSTPTAFASNFTFQKNVYGQTVTFTETVVINGITKAPTATIFWLQRVYYGVGTAGQTGEAFILSLASSFIAASKDGGYPFVAGAADKCYIAYRSAYGDSVFRIGGFVTTFSKSVALVTNAFGFAENYDLWESGSVNLGAVTVVVSNS